MKPLERALNDLVIANRILANEDVVDAYGHVSIRHPDDPTRYFLARSLSPEQVTRRDIMEFDLEGRILGKDTRQPYLERFIHGAIYESRPEVQAVVHAHAEAVLPFTIADGTKLQPAIHSGSFMGLEVPVWDIRDRFGDTNLLVTNVEQGRDLAQTLGSSNVALMRGHGFALNARALLGAKALGGSMKLLSAGEIAARNAGYKPYSPETWRAWEYWARRAGCAAMVTRPEPKPTSRPKKKL
jgi:ribulose-5-phosphate 4-epimerase/fuculose-1-phosphate aldolase